MSDRVSSVAFDPSAPWGERSAASMELQKSVVSGGLDNLLPQDAVRDVINFIQEQYAEDAMNKAIRSNIVPFPSKRAKDRDRGMQSVFFDDWQVSVQGEYWERPSILSFDSLRSMVEQTPILNAVIMTRVRQVQRFCRVAEKNTDAPGFEIRHIDRSHQLSDSEQDSINLLNRFIMNCGWEFRPRRRKQLKRDSFAQFMAKVTRDSLSMDSVGIETEWKREKSLGIDGFYAVDGSSIRLCTERGYEGDDEIFALQVVQGRISTAYGYEDLIYEPRNPRSDVRVCGYGLSETELLVRVVTGFLNAMSYNIKGFDQNSIPKGMLHLSGNYSTDDISAFKRYWNSMVKGVNNAWALPVMVSKDQDSKASFEKFGVDFNEMYFSKWMTFLTSVICAVYGMSPAEINFDSFTGGNTSALSGSDTMEKLAASKDSGLRPLLSYFENLITDYVVQEFSDNYAFRWTGLDPADAQQKFEMRKLILTVDEARAEEGLEAHEDPTIGKAPLNPSLMGIYQTGLQGDGDFGAPPDATADGAQLEGEQTVQPVDETVDADEEQAQADEDAATAGMDGATVDEGASSGDEEDFGKAMPPVFVVE